MDATHAIRVRREELANAWTHGLGAVAALVAGTVLVLLAGSRGDGWQLASAIVFAVALLALYLASTLYHSASGIAARARMKVVDHCAIYLLIAGTYTPFTLVGLRGALGWRLFAAVWVLAAAGIAFKLSAAGKPVGTRAKWLSTAIYVAMGWLVLVAIRPVMAALDGWTFGWLVAGGAFYTLGTAFYHRASVAYSHAVWHLFCIAGSASHYIAVLAQVVPSA